MSSHGSREPTGPKARTRTVRQSLTDLLLQGPQRLSELSHELGVGERELCDHLEHLAQAARYRFRIEPSRCTRCGFSFADRARIRRPSRCPKCRSERLSQPRFSLGLR